RTELKTVDRASANATFSPYRELKVEEGFALDAVKLHELYFDNLGGPGGRPTGKALSLIERDFGSYEAWEADLKAAGISARGWVVTAYDLEDGQLHNFICDVHNQGGIWSAIPIVVLDVYEHAYFVDYGTRRAAYLDAFVANLDWETIGSRLGKLA
ncbi:MAG: Fe-Mn family superoxide dismutase, partial [Dehalococcoidia bacterium]|nr:Fe-Mn family superoxide dismutase [Dehalococcoidia bacterium]